MNKYAKKTIQLTKGSVTFNATIADTCKDSDCSGCCSANAKPSGFLVDMEYYTVLRRFGNTDAADGTLSFTIF